MFDKFGEFDSCKEINELAENLLNEGDEDSLRIMAKENGIDDYFVDMYLEGDVECLADASVAAIGKIEVESEELKPKNIMVDWVEYIKAEAEDNEVFAHRVRKKGKSLKGCIAALLKWSFKNQMDIDKAIIKEAGVNAGRVSLGIPGRAECRKIITDYYMGK